MSLISCISDLASRIGLEVRSRITGNHPGLARAWVCFGVINQEVTVRASFNIASVIRLSAGRYRITFQSKLKDQHYCWTGFARSNSHIGVCRSLVARNIDKKTPRFLDVACLINACLPDDSIEINLVVYR